MKIVITVEPRYHELG